MSSLKKISGFFWLIGILLVLVTATPAGGETKPLNLERIQEKLVPPPGVPKHEQAVSAAPRIVEVRLTIREMRHQIAPDGAAIWAMTYEGSIPGPLIVVHQDDYVELTLVNPADNILQHNIDFHAATGAMGGGELTKVNPGQQAILRFKATKPGVFVYHCAPGGAMTPLHVVSGMNGAIMVLPRDGLKDSKGRPATYDRAYYIGEQDFYVPKEERGAYKQYSTPVAGLGEMLEVMKTLTPTHLVFNGQVGALLGKNALKAKVGEKVLFIHSQANRDSRVHLIGGHADLVWQGGSFADQPRTNFETWMVPGGTAVAALYEFLQPGKYVYVNHNLIEGILFGAVAEVDVEGEWENDLMNQTSPPGPIQR
jgi:nitrite reductase (NO-forming)